MASSSSSDNTLPMNTLLHLIPVKLNSTNYLVWKNHVTPVFAYQKLLSHLDGSSTKPERTVASTDKVLENPEFLSWTERDQRAVIILNSSLSEEAASEVLGLSTAREIWVALEHAYSNTSIERAYTLRDSLRQLTKGNSTVAEYGRKFKLLCDQLAAIGQPVHDMDKLHWFLCGLGPSFESFSVSIKTVKPGPVFRDLVSQAESHEMFLKSIHASSPPVVAFNANHNRSPQTETHNRGRYNTYRGRGGLNNQNRSKGRGTRTPRCQLCRTFGHYASECPNYTFTARSSSTEDDIAKAFHAKCHVSHDTPDWKVDSGATAHMTSDPGHLHHTHHHNNGPPHETGPC